MGIPYPYPDGLFEEQVVVFTPPGGASRVLQADPKRIFVRVSGESTTWWGFTPEVDSGNRVGTEMIDVRWLEWTWDTSGPLCQRELFYDDNFAGLPVTIETVVNWPKSMKPDLEAMRLKQLEKTQQAQRVGRIRQRILNTRQLIASRQANGRA